jgi:hypothetical protein
LPTSDHAAFGLGLLCTGHRAQCVVDRTLTQSGDRSLLASAAAQSGYTTPTNRNAFVLGDRTTVDFW